MAKKPKKINDCTPENVVSMFNRLGGFSVVEGRKHIKVKHDTTGMATMIPRKKRVNPHLLRDIIEDFLVRDLGFDEEAVYKKLKC